MTADPFELTRDLIDAGRELQQVTLEYAEACDAMASAKVAHQKAYLTAHATLRIQQPDLRVQALENEAQKAALDEWADLVAVEYRCKALRERAHSLRQILSGHQTRHRVESSYSGMDR